MFLVFYYCPHFTVFVLQSFIILTMFILRCSDFIFINKKIQMGMQGMQLLIEYAMACGRVTVRRLGDKCNTARSVISCIATITKYYKFKSRYQNRLRKLIKPILTEAQSGFREAYLINHAFVYISQKKLQTEYNSKIYGIT